MSAILDSSTILINMEKQTEPVNLTKHITLSASSPEFKPANLVNRVTLSASSLDFKIGKYRLLINARYVVTEPIEVVLESGESYRITNEKMTVNRIEKDGDEVILRWIRLDTFRPAELKLTKGYDKLQFFRNFAY